MLIDLLKDKKKFFGKVKFTPFLMQYPSPDLWSKNFSKSDFLDNILDLEIKDLNIYLHIPFCDYLCKYCSFSKILLKNDMIDKYFLGLEQEISFWNKLLDFSKINIKTIFIGGGTPSVLNKQQIERLWTIFEKYNIKTDWEFSIETNPDRIDDNFKIWQNIWVNRISIWQQTFNENVLKSQNRNFIDFNNFSKKISFLRKIWFENINIDMIYGWDVENYNQILKDDIKKLSIILPEHISFYPLILYYKKLNNKELAGFFEKLEQQYDFISSNLDYNFYTLEYAIKKWLSQDYRHTYQVNYLKWENVLWFWPSWFSFLENIWFKNYFYLNEYLNAKFYPEYVYFVKNEIVDYQRKFILWLRLNIIEKKVVNYLENIGFLNKQNLFIFDENYILKPEYKKYQDLLLYYFNQKFNELSPY